MPSGIYENNKKDRVGIRYGRLIVIKFAYSKWELNKTRIFWLCKCDCGKEKVILGDSLKSGNTKSCGCLYKERKDENHSCYIDGRCKRNLELKEKIRKRDNYICQDCGITQEEYKKKHNRILDVHHIDGDNTNNVEENMITFCRGCHRKHDIKK